MIVLLLTTIVLSQISTPYTVFDDIDYTDVDVEAELQKWIKELTDTYLTGHFVAADKFLQTAHDWINDFNISEDFNHMTESTVKQFNDKT